MTVARGQRIAQRFELDSHLPDVGLGECWSAQDLHRPDSPAQVEFLSAPAASGAATREAFDALIARLRPVSNPGLLGVLGGGEIDGRLFVVTERLEGRSLANWLAGHRQAGTRPGLTVVQRVFDKVCNALQFAHAVAPQPVVHRALTPRSILLRRVGPGQHHVKVGDFGLAPFSPGAASGAIGAWWEYQAPEQHGGRWNEPAAVDVFALAVVLVEMLALTALPRAEGRETWWQYVKESRGVALDRLVTLRGDVPRGVWEVIAAAMKLSARERTPSVQRLQRTLRDAWQAAGDWQPGAGAEAEPPVPASLADASMLVRAAPGATARAAAVIDGWQAAERRPDAAPRASWPEAAPVPAAAIVPMPAVDIKATLPMMAAVMPGSRPVTDSTEMIDLVRHGVFAPPMTHAGAPQESTMALDLAALDPRGHGGASAGRPGADLFGEAFEGDSDLDPAVGTQVMAQVGGDTQPPPPHPEVPDDRHDPTNTTRAIDTAAAFAQLDLAAPRGLPAEAMATMKAPSRSRRFDPAPPRADDRPDDLRATHVMLKARAPVGFAVPSGVLSDATGDPFARDSFAGDPFAPSSPSVPPVEPTMAVPIEAMLAGAYGQADVPRRSMPGSAPPMNTPFAMGAPPRDSESRPASAPAATILGQPAWLMIALALVLVVSVASAAFLLAGGR